MLPMRNFILPLALLAAASGCQRPMPALHVTSAPVKMLPAGWTEAASPDGVVKVGVPSGWRHGVDRLGGMMDLQNFGLTEGDMANPDVQRITQQTEAQGAAEEKQKLEELFQKGIVLHVINGSKPIADEARTRFVVQRYERSSNWSLDDAAEEERKQYGHKPNRQDVALPIGKAVKLSLSEELRNGSTRHRISYLAADGKKLYVLRFVTEEAKDAIQSIADPVAETWRIQPSK
jgi:hypothetical protein